MDGEHRRLIKLHLFHIRQHLFLIYLSSTKETSAFSNEIGARGTHPSSFAISPWHMRVKQSAVEKIIPSNLYHFSFQNKSDTRNLGMYMNMT